VIFKITNSFRKACSTRRLHSCCSEEQRKLFLDWVLTANFHGYPDRWYKVFAEAAYAGDYYWTVVE